MGQIAAQTIWLSMRVNEQSISKILKEPVIRTLEFGQIESFLDKAFDITF